jgi:hypothetical protein
VSRKGPEREHVAWPARGGVKRMAGGGQWTHRAFEALGSRPVTALGTLPALGALPSVRCAAGKNSITCIAGKTALRALSLAEARVVSRRGAAGARLPPPLREEAVAVHHSAVAVHHSGLPGLGPEGVDSIVPLNFGVSFPWASEAQRTFQTRKKSQYKYA